MVQRKSRLISVLCCRLLTWWIWICTRCVWYTESSGDCCRLLTWWLCCRYSAVEVFILCINIDVLFLFSIWRNNGVGGGGSINVMYRFVLCCVIEWKDDCSRLDKSLILLSVRSPVQSSVVARTIYCNNTSLDTVESNWQLHWNEQEKQVNGRVTVA